MFKKSLTTTDSFGPTLLRIALAAAMFPHGAQKLLGWFGGSGYSATVETFTGPMDIPLVLTLAVITTEFLGSILLLIGFLTRIWAIGFAILMTTAALKVHWVNGFFMNWSGKQDGEGVEYHVLAVGIALALLVMGGGALSVDGTMAGKKPKASRSSAGS